MKKEETYLTSELPIGSVLYLPYGDWYAVVENRTEHATTLGCYDSNPSYDPHAKKVNSITLNRHSNYEGLNLIRTPKPSTDNKLIQKVYETMHKQGWSFYDGRLNFDAYYESAKHYLMTNLDKDVSIGFLSDFIETLEKIIKEQSQHGNNKV